MTNLITTDTALIPMDNRTLFYEFLNFKQSTLKGKKSFSFYKTAIKNFYQFLERIESNIIELDKSDFIAYREYLSNFNGKGNLVTANNYLGIVKIFAKWLTSSLIWILKYQSGT